MQCASSITIRPTRASKAPSRAAKRGLPSRSGETSSTSMVSASSRWKTSSQSSMFVELTVAAFRPARSAALTWSRISAKSGETTSVGPAPVLRIACVAAQYTADLPQPVACTTSTRDAGCSTACTASTWSARAAAPGPARRASMVCMCCSANSRSTLPMVVI